MRLVGATRYKCDRCKSKATEEDALRSGWIVVGDWFLGSLPDDSAKYDLKHFCSHACAAKELRAMARRMVENGRDA